MSKLLPDGVSIRWWGHSTFSVGGNGQTFLFDPFFAQNPKFPKQFDAEVRAPGAFDAIVVTHPHFDHFDDALPLLKGDPKLKAILQFDIADWVRSQGIADERLVRMNTGGTITFEGVRITMVNAVHSSSLLGQGAPQSLGFPVGFVLRFPNGFTIYNTGDTAVTLDMQIVRDLYKPNLVILPIGDAFTMGPEQAAYALNLLKPEFAVGAHYGTWDGNPPGTPEMLENEMTRLSLQTKLIKLQPGETLA